jgi:hypothetical protein
MNMKTYLPLIVLTLAAMACSLSATVTPIASGSTPDGAQPLPGDSVPATLPPAQGPTGSGTLSLRIISPVDGAIVNTSIVEIVGEAPAGSVISIGDDILIVGADGVFKHIVTLEEGPNLIEILASDAGGNESYVLLAIFYEP